MSQLTSEQRVSLIKQLDARERLLISVIDEHLAGLRASNVPETSTLAGDIADLAEIELARDRQHAAVDHDLRALNDINATRARVIAGNFGSCIDCGEEIGFDRLQAHPTASRCVSCQDLYEQSHLLASSLAT